MYPQKNKIIYAILALVLIAFGLLQINIGSAGSILKYISFFVLFLGIYILLSIIFNIKPFSVNGSSGSVEKSTKRNRLIYGLVSAYLLVYWLIYLKDGFTLSGKNIYILFLLIFALYIVVAAIFKLKPFANTKEN